MSAEKTEYGHEQGHSALGTTGLQTTNDVERIEAPVTWKAYVICAFASIGGIFFGYDSGYINGVNGSAAFYQAVEGNSTATALSSSNQSLIVSILSAGTFFGALIAGDIAEFIGRKWTVVVGCLIYVLGVVIQVATTPNSSALGTMVAGRFVAGLGVGFESAIVILYMSEIVSNILSRTAFSFPSTSFTDHYPSEIVPSQGSWRSSRWLSILHHHWTSTRFLYRVRHGKHERSPSVPYSHRHSVHLGCYSRWRSDVPARLSPLLCQARQAR